jgi:hypothetical protein
MSLDKRYSTFHAGPEYRGVVFKFHILPPFKQDFLYKYPDSRMRAWVQGYLKLWPRPTYHVIGLRVGATDSEFELFRKMVAHLCSDPRRVVVDQVIEEGKADGDHWGKVFTYSHVDPRRWPNMPAQQE